MADNEISADAFVAAMRSVLDSVVDSQFAAVRAAGAVVAEAVRGGAVIQAFGAGHSEAAAMEIASRAGGLVPTNKIALRDMVVFGGKPVDMLFDTTLERDAAVGRELFRLAAPDPRDVFVLASNSGVNAAVVELALLAKEHGHYVIAITSAQHSAASAPKHASGRRLSEVADVALDNGAPLGDAVLPLDTGGAACGISSISAALLAQALTAEIIRNITAAGDLPPVYLSANVPGGDEHNHAAEARYAGRIRRTA